MLHWLDERLWFPPTTQAMRDPDGLLAAGGDLRPERLIYAYQRGIFPWYNDDSPILWWSPAPRFVLQPGQLYINRTLNKVIRHQPFTISINRAFPSVIRLCAETKREGQNGTWIHPEMVDAYCTLHQQGWSHSVEAWSGNQLVGGLYGMAIGRVFYGESMFSLQSNASKVAFALWAQLLFELGCELIDCQMKTEHMQKLGGQAVTRKAFEALLISAKKEPSYLKQRISPLNGIALSAQDLSNAT